MANVEDMFLIESENPDATESFRMMSVTASSRQSHASTPTASLSSGMSRAISSSHSVSKPTSGVPVHASFGPPSTNSVSTSTSITTSDLLMQHHDAINMAKFAELPSQGKNEVIAPVLCCGVRVCALVDSGCTKTLISPLLASALKLPIKSANGTISLGINGLSVSRLGTTICPTIQLDCCICENANLELAELPSSYHLVLGMGISLLS